MGLVVAIPLYKNRIIGIFKHKAKRRRFNVAVAEENVCFAAVA